MVFTGYHLPHYVMVFFVKQANGSMPENNEYAAGRAQYYRRLKEEGKVCLSGSSQSTAGDFVLFFVADHFELWQLAEQDPAVQAGLLRIADAYPVNINMQQHPAVL